MILLVNILSEVVHIIDLNLSRVARKYWVVIVYIPFYLGTLAFINWHVIMKYKIIKIVYPFFYIIIIELNHYISPE
jgi:multidrug transporter EmrE-like cation transporter